MNIIVPVDFSPTSQNAANFAAKMLSGNEQASMILYHVFTDEEGETEVSNKLRSLKDSLLKENKLKIEWIAEYSYDFIESLEKKIRQFDSVLMVMAIAEKSKVEQVLGVSNSLTMIEKNLCPVLVIPPNVKYNRIKNLALACDFKNVFNTIPFEPVKKVLNLFNANLHIVNVNSEIYVSLSREYLEQRLHLQQMFQEFNPDFYFITTEGFHDSLRRFIADKNIDLVLTFPRKHSFINNLIKGNNTKKLVYESAIPVLAAHE